MSQVTWDGEGYSKNSAIQEHYANYFMNEVPTFPKLERKEGGVILDIGCGDGRLTKRIFDKVGGTIYGVDFSEEQIGHARANHTTKQGEENLLYFAIDATELNLLPSRYPDEITEIEGKVDRIISFNCIHWIPDHVKLFKSIYGVLKKGGRVDILFGWESPEHDAAIKALQQIYPELHNIEDPNYWFSNTCKNNFLKSITKENDVTYTFGAKDEGTQKLLKAYNTFLTEIGFVIEELSILEYQLPAQYACKSIEELEGFVWQWFPYKSLFDSVEKQKEVIRKYCEMSFFQIKDENGNITGYGFSLQGAQFHLRKD